MPRRSRPARGRASSTSVRWTNIIISPESALADLYEVMLTDEQAGRVFSGNEVLLRGRDAPAFCDEAYATGHGRLIALGAVEQGSFKPKRVFGGRG